MQSITEGFLENFNTIGIFVDLGNAFDTVDHDVLLKKVEIGGIKRSHLKWFHFYLRNRQQFMEFSS